MLFLLRRGFLAIEEQKLGAEQTDTVDAVMYRFGGVTLRGNVGDHLYVLTIRGKSRSTSLEKKVFGPNALSRRGSFVLISLRGVGGHFHNARGAVDEQGGAVRDGQDLFAGAYHHRDAEGAGQDDAVRHGGPVGSDNPGYRGGVEVCGLGRCEVSDNHDA
jgi:hypothetical protein